MASQQEIEMRLLAHAIASSEDIALLIHEGIRPEHFSYEGPLDRKSITRGLYAKALDYHLRYDRLLTREALELDLKSQLGEIREGTTASRYVSTFVKASTYRVDSNTLPALIRQFREQLVLTALHESVKLVEAGLRDTGPMETFENLRMRIEEFQSELVVSGGEKPKYFNVLTDMDSVWEQLEDRKMNPEKYKGIEIGLKVIDNALRGFKDGTLNLFAAEPGGGKSVALLNAAAEVYEKGNNVIFVSLEMPLWQVQARLVARTARIPYEEFVHAEMTPEMEAKAKRRFESFGGSNIASDMIDSLNPSNYFIIVDQPSETGATVSFVESVIKRYSMLGRADAIFVDYLGEMVAPNLPTSAKTYEHQGECARGLRMIARVRELTMFSAHQLTKDALKQTRKKMVDDPLEATMYVESLGGDSKISHRCDSIIGLAADPQGQKMGFYKIKGRDFHFERFTARYRPEMSFIQDMVTDDFELPSSMLMPELDGLAESSVIDREAEEMGDMDEMDSRIR